jgi:hypothetical protein
MRLDKVTLTGLTLFLIFVSIWLIVLEGAQVYSIGLLVYNAVNLMRNIYSGYANNRNPHLLTGRRKKIYDSIGLLSFTVQVAWGIWTLAGFKSITEGYDSRSYSFVEFFYYFTIVTFVFIGVLFLLLCCLFTGSHASRDGERAADDNLFNNPPNPNLEAGINANVDANASANPSINAGRKNMLTTIREMAKNIIDESPNCSICLEDYAASDSIRKLGCGHFYHESCIDRWLSQSRECPYCKQPV